MNWSRIFRSQQPKLPEYDFGLDRWPDRGKPLTNDEIRASADRNRPAAVMADIGRVLLITAVIVIAIFATIMLLYGALHGMSHRSVPH